MGLEGIGWSVLGGVATAIVLYLFNWLIRDFRRWRSLQVLSGIISNFERESTNLAIPKFVGDLGISTDDVLRNKWRAHLESVKNWIQTNSAVMKPEQCHQLLTTIYNQELAADTLRASAGVEFEWDVVFRSYIDALSGIPWLPFERRR